MVISVSDVPLTNVDDVEGLKIGDPAVQVAQFGPGNQKSPAPPSRTTSNDWGLYKMSEMDIEKILEAIIQQWL